MGWFSPKEPETGNTATPQAEPVRAPTPAPPAAVQPPTEPDPSTRASLASLLTGRPAPPPAEVAGTSGEDTASVFAESVDIEGSLEGQGDVVLRGRVRGSINISGSLLVTQGGSVQADVCAREVINAGTVEGNITASEKVRVQATGLVKGDIDSPSIVIDDGGGVEGFVQMEPPGCDGDFEDDDLPPRPPAPPPPASMRFPSRPAAAAGAERSAPPSAAEGVARSTVALPPALGPASLGSALLGSASTVAASMAPEPQAAPKAAPKAPPAGDPLAMFFEETAGERSQVPSGNGSAGVQPDDPFAESDEPDDPLPEL